MLGDLGKSLSGSESMSALKACTENIRIRVDTNTLRSEGFFIKVSFENALAKVRPEFSISNNNSFHTDHHDQDFPEKDESEGEEKVSDHSTNETEKKKKRKKKNARLDEQDYDLDDPFINDSEDEEFDQFVNPENSVLDLISRDFTDNSTKTSKVMVGEHAAATAMATWGTLRTKNAVTVIPAMSEAYYVWRGRLPDPEVETSLINQETGIINIKGANVSVKKRKKASKSINSQPKTKKVHNKNEKSKKRPRLMNEDSQPNEEPVNSQQLNYLEQDKKDAKKSQNLVLKPVKEKKRMNRPKIINSEDENPTPSGPVETQLKENVSKIEEHSENVIGNKLNETKLITGSRKKVDSSTPFSELELRLAVTNYQKQVAHTPFADPKKFPASLRPAFNEVIICALRLSNILPKNSIDPECKFPHVAVPEESVYTELASGTPFSPVAIRNMIYSRALALMKKDFNTSIERFYATLKAEYISFTNTQDSSYSDVETGRDTNVSETEIVAARKTGGNLKLSDEAKQALYMIVRGEMDIILIERFEALTAYDPASFTRPPRHITTSFAELSIRKSTYNRISELLNKQLTSSEIGFEYNALRKRIEAQRLREHNISPIVQYVLTKSSSATHMMVNDSTNANMVETPPSSSAIDEEYTDIVQPRDTEPPMSEKPQQIITERLREIIFNENTNHDCDPSFNTELISSAKFPDELGSKPKIEPPNTGRIDFDANVHPTVILDASKMMSDE